MKRLDLIRHIKKSGCKKHNRAGAKHEIYFNPKGNLVSSIPRHKEIPSGTIKAICKQLEPVQNLYYAGGKPLIFCASLLTYV